MGNDGQARPATGAPAIAARAVLHAAADRRAGASIDFAAIGRGGVLRGLLLSLGLGLPDALLARGVHLLELLEVHPPALPSRQDWTSPVPILEAGEVLRPDPGVAG